MINIWDVHTQKVIKKFNMLANNFAVSPDGKTLVVSEYKHVYLINFSTNTSRY